MKSFTFAGNFLKRTCKTCNTCCLIPEKFVRVSLYVLMPYYGMPFLLLHFLHVYFFLQAQEAGKLLHSKEHEVLDGAGKSMTIYTLVECKDISSSNDRYVCCLNPLNS